MIKGFRDFLLRGNVVDLAVAVVIGAAFSAIVGSLVADLINPLLAAIVGKPDFSAFVLTLHGGKIKYGNFMNAVITFVLNASAVYFLFVLPFSAMLKRFAAPPPPVTTRPCPECLSDIPKAATRCSHCAQPSPAVA
jgi:large conductance mechanosensitive channel